MAYKRIITMDIWELVRRWHDQQNISHIAQSLDYDRKTTRKYIQLAQQKGITLDKPLPEKEQVIDNAMCYAVELCEKWGILHKVMSICTECQIVTFLCVTQCEYYLPGYLTIYSY